MSGHGGASPLSRRSVMHGLAATCAGAVALPALARAAMPLPRRPYVERTLLWLMKFDILRLTSATPLRPLTGDQPGGPDV